MEWIVLIAVIIWMLYVASALSSLCASAGVIATNLEKIQNGLEQPKAISEQLVSIKDVSSNLAIIAGHLATLIDQKDCEMYTNAMMEQNGWTYDQSMAQWEKLEQERRDAQVAETLEKLRKLQSTDQK